MLVACALCMHCEKGDNNVVRKKGRGVIVGSILKTLCQGMTSHSFIKLNQATILVIYCKHPMCFNLFMMRVIGKIDEIG